MLASHARLQLRSDQQLGSDDDSWLRAWDLVSPSFKSCHGSHAYKARTRKHRTASAIFSMHAYVATSEMLPGLDPVRTGIQAHLPNSVDAMLTCPVERATHTHLHAYHTCIPVSFFLLFLYTVYSFYIYAVRHLPPMWMITRYSNVQIGITVAKWNPEHGCGSELLRFSATFRKYAASPRCNGTQKPYFSTYKNCKQFFLHVEDIRMYVRALFVLKFGSM
jgi:hypothetical protein